MKSISIHSETYHYSLTGPEGSPVVVFSNSLGTTQAMWQKQVSALSTRYRVLTYDTRGHGLAAGASAPSTIAQLGEDVLNLLDALHIDTATFCGISMGGLIGQWLGIHAGSRLDKLVLCNTAAKIGQVTAWRDRAELVRSAGMAEVASGAAARWFSADFATQHPNEVQHLIATLRDMDPAGYAACCEAIAQADFREQIAAITTPTWIVAGVLDPVTTVADADAMAEKISGSRRIDLQASHLSNVEASEAFNAAMVKILSD